MEGPRRLRVSAAEISPFLCLWEVKSAHQIHLKRGKLATSGPHRGSYKLLGPLIE